MSSDPRFSAGTPQPVCVGTGLLALDAIVDKTTPTPPVLRSGGSCGNVMAALAYLGWKTYPVARLGDDAASGKILDDLKIWSVSVDLVERSASGNTPIIMEAIDRTPQGVPFHKFEWICPCCHSWFPRYKPVLARDVERISSGMPTPQVFYFDRAVRSSLELAKISKAHGAVIFFEPSSMQNTALFAACLQVSDVVKYSRDRLERLPMVTDHLQLPLEIETLGSAGLRYRLHREEGGPRVWEALPAYTANHFIDSAGAGDWCSAGLMHSVCGSGLRGLIAASEEAIRDAINFGQALGAVNCAFQGPRGSMYELSKEQFQDAVSKTLEGIYAPEPTRPGPAHPLADTVAVWNSVCNSCQQIAGASRHT